MKIRHCLATAALFAAIPAFGQHPARTELSEVVSVLQAARSGQSARVGREVYEDIEVMRRLLARRLGGRDAASDITYWSWRAPQGNQLPMAQFPAQQPFYASYLAANADYPTPGAFGGLSASRPAGPVAEGVYLPNKGVVFTLTIPKPAKDPMPTASASIPAKPDNDEWTALQRQIRGERDDPPAKAETPKPSTADLILKVLAENGKHLRVGNDEDVTVVVTFRGEGTAQQAAAANPFMFGGDATVPMTGTVSTPATANLVPADPVAQAGHGKSARDFELLGDLHLRQKRYQEAIDAYQGMVKLAEPAGDLKQLADSYRKMSEAMMQLGRLDEAKSLLERAIETQGKQKAPAKTADQKSDDKPKPVALPAKLILTVPKRLLDDAGSGKITFEEFKKAVRVDYFAFAAEKK